jgi:hypothetical protein
VEFDGHIIGASFASGDTIVAGRWLRSPFGPFADVMWRRADGRRVLLAPDAGIGGFVSSQYTFDEVRTAPVRVERGGGRVEANAGPVRMLLGPRPRGVPSWLLAARPRRLRHARSWIAAEDRLLRPLVHRAFGARDVRTYGATRAGVREWYAIHDLRHADAEAWIDGRNLGPTVPGPPAGFGFSEFPGRPAIVRVTSMFDLEDDGSRRAG